MHHATIAAIAGTRSYRKNFGDLPALTAHIRAHGLTHPIIINPHGWLFAGARRLKAYQTLGHTTIPAITITGLTATLTAIINQNHDRTCAHPMTIAERHELAELLDNHLRPLRGQHRPPDIPAGRAGTDHMRSLLSNAVGLPSALARVKTVYASLHHPDPAVVALAQRAVAQFDTSCNHKIIGRIYEAIRDARAIAEHRAPPSREQPLAEQRAAMLGAQATLAGVCQGLASIGDIHPQVSAPEIEQWLTALTENRRVITALIARLKGAHRP